MAAILEIRKYKHCQKYRDKMHEIVLFVPNFAAIENKYVTVACGVFDSKLTPIFCKIKIWDARDLKVKTVN